jgi:hypothetical protein
LLLLHTPLQLKSLLLGHESLPPCLNHLRVPMTSRSAGCSVQLCCDVRQACCILQ